MKKSYIIIIAVIFITVVSILVYGTLKSKSVSQAIENEIVTEFKLFGNKEGKLPESLKSFENGSSFNEKVMRVEGGSFILTKYEWASFQMRFEKNLVVLEPDPILLGYWSVDSINLIYDEMQQHVTQKP